MFPRICFRGGVLHFSLHYPGPNLFKLASEDALAVFFTKFKFIIVNVIVCKS